ncbi:amidohydrolase family protein [Amycolatopsis sp. WQ 127309]|uniref:amidohydrolase family protein n=1 Tax=Amycolatopsis sp. WQ 127309 TaxID=2932773 RepID=UPI001FF516B8|nr:amidohydrolase family protein [Amycolatopsis sp. WQ 127309]UOZ03454.1 amidohydrolase [Amycolatopsis sp. WQ 127309]
MIDVHSHWFPPAFSATYERVTGREAWPPHPADLRDRIADIEAAGLELQILGSGHNQPYSEDRATAVDAARAFNDLYADAVSRHGGRLGAFGAIPLPHADEAIAEAIRCLDELSFAGIGVGTTAVGRSLSDPDFEPLWAELHRRRTTVFVHPVVTPDRFTLSPDPYAMGPKFGGPLEATMAAAHLVVSGVTRRYPGINWVIAPMGGTLPYLWRRFEESSQAMGQDDLLAGDPATELKKLYYDTTLSDDPRVIRFMVDAVGIDQLVFGSDAPKVTATDWIGRMKKTRLFGDDDLGKLLGGTARTRLGL